MKQLDSILLIDDDMITNYLHQSLIEELHVAHNVVVCQDGKMALEYLQQCLQQGSFPDLIFVDLNMPVLDGFGFLKSYKANNFHKRFSSLVTVLTTSLNSSDVEKVKQENIAGFINKPLLPEMLKELTSAYLTQNWE